MGFSWGDMVTTLAAYEQISRTYLGNAGLRFSDHVAYYGCSIPRLQRPIATGAPVLMMIGEKDENVSVERTRIICDDLRRGGAPVELKIFDAFHQWDGIDEEKRHVFGSLADLHIMIGPDNGLCDEHSDKETGTALTQSLVLLRDLKWGGYDIKRDEALHHETDEHLIEFLRRIAQKAEVHDIRPNAFAYGAVGYIQQIARNNPNQFLRTKT